MVFVMAAVLGGAGCVLPWVRTAGSPGHDRIEAAEEIMSATRPNLDPVDFLWFDGGEVASAAAEPLGGANVWQIALSERGVTAYAGDVLSRPAGRAFGKYALALAPVAVLVLAFLGTRGLPRGMPGKFAGGALLLVYALIRWRIAATEGARVVADIQIGLGAWLTALAALVAALVFFAREAFPKAKWL